MEETTFRIRVMLMFVLFSGAVALGVFSYEVVGQEAGERSSPASSLLTVAFLDVGQGDAIFVETPDGVQVLIDGGVNNSVLRELSKQMPLTDRSLDMIIATHPDKDHIGGLVDVLSRYEVESIVRTDNQGETATINAFNLAVREETLNIYYAMAGQQWALGASTSIMIWSPAGSVENWESNTSSVVMQLRYGDIEFMLTGDAPSSVEEYLGRTFGEVLESEVLKLGHHGSRTSTADSFLALVDPDFAVVSAGEDNTYGHPHAEVVEKVRAKNIEILSTAENGSVVFKSDGKRVWVVR